MVVHDPIPRRVRANVYSRQIGKWHNNTVKIQHGEPMSLLKLLTGVWGRGYLQEREWLKTTSIPEWVVAQESWNPGSLWTNCMGLDRPESSLLSFYWLYAVRDGQSLWILYVSDISWYLCVAYCLSLKGSPIWSSWALTSFPQDRMWCLRGNCTNMNTGTVWLHQLLQIPGVFHIIPDIAFILSAASCA